MKYDCHKKYDEILYDKSYEPIYFSSNIFLSYLEYRNLSKYKNLFKNDLTIIPEKTIKDILYYNTKDNKYNYVIENKCIKSNNVIIEFLEDIFKFYGWFKIDDFTLSPMYDIIDPDKWILENTDEGKLETMHLNFYNINYSDLIKRCSIESKISINTNIFYDCCFNENATIFKDLFDKDISIDALSTIKQIKCFYDDVIYDYDGYYIHIRRKRLNKWNTPLEMLFKFYGWYPKDDRTLYPKYKIFNLKDYKTNEH